jgi:hypothetical protein
MRSASEPGSREEDTIPVRCRDTRSEGGGYGARLSDTLNMNSIDPVDNTGSDMSAMQSMQRLKKECGPARGESGATSVAGTSSRKEGTQQEQGRRRSARCAEADIGRALLPNNRASDIQAMRMMHVKWNKRFESTVGGSKRPFRRAPIQRRAATPAGPRVTAGRGPSSSKNDFESRSSRGVLWSSTTRHRSAWGARSRRRCGPDRIAAACRPTV